jgi:predicted transcriptional regulator
VAYLVFSSTALAFLTNMSEKHKSASTSAIQVKNRQKTIVIIEKLHIIMRCEKGEQIVDICHNVRLAYGIIHTICDNVDRIKEGARSGTKVFVLQDYHSPI